MTAGRAATWSALDQELARWAAAGQVATFWWRDDDAGTATPALTRLLDLTTAHGVVPLLATVPDWAEPSLPDLLAGHAAAAAQHGVAHRDRSGGAGKKTELLDGLPDLENALRDGRVRLEALLGPRLLSVLVPPWNRIGPVLRGRLGPLGYRGLSAYKPRAAAREGAVTVVNCHCDPVAWHEGRVFAGEAAALGQVVAHLRDRRQGRVDADEPTGILTHHAVHDSETWRFLEGLADRLALHPAASWQDPRQLFAGTP
ncbi:hypothetical protein ACFOGJ_08625 [Marinibaculum pumilum]|uniref:Polysaccharide deacetylase n=1 Tax=Marinibaculum pumilum TaxID=1766165 RepID=A0ABV7KY02_9PROT